VTLLLPHFSELLKNISDIFNFNILSNRGIII
jgi:hypothetical protein